MIIPFKHNTFKNGMFLGADQTLQFPPIRQSPLLARKVRPAKAETPSQEPFDYHAALRGKIRGHIRSEKVPNLLTADFTIHSSLSDPYENLCRHYLQGIDLNQGDYDSRTALHVAAAEGQLDCVKFLLDTCAVNPQPKDRY